MNKIEVVLGITVFLLSVLSILFINLGVVPSREYPGHYTYGFLSGFSEILLILLSLEGIVAIMHAAQRHRSLEFGLGIVIILWGFLALMWVAMSLIDGRSPYIKEFPTSVTRAWLPIIPGIFLGIALTLDGIRRKTPLSSKRANQNLS